MNEDYIISKLNESNHLYFLDYFGTVSLQTDLSREGGTENR